MKVSFVIPIFNHWSLINDLMVDIHNNCTPYEVVIVDDYSNDPVTLEGVEWWARNHSDIKVYRPLENLGFLKASNYGVSKTTGDVICLISSDVRIEEDLAAIVREFLARQPKSLIGGIVYKESTGWNQFEGKVFPYVEGWLICCLRSVWYDLGGFDEQFAPNDFEDVDLSTTAVTKGYSLASLNSGHIRHIGAQTIGYNEARSALTERNREKFRLKWITNQSTTDTSQQTS